MSGEHIGKYRVLAKLGQGGMARVLLTMSQGPRGFNKLLVVKELREELANDPDFVAMFMDEARIAARLNHPNIVQTYEVGEDGESRQSATASFTTVTPSPPSPSLPLSRLVTAGLARKNSRTAWRSLPVPLPWMMRTHGRPAR